ncbi:radical SAM superfamily protein [Colletotrichum fioriniae PJ7]|uniref:Radical SAM superfamily protein n=1 Tax=Colletotrichum fioriniae PJ7 TaxID=1445577 RepID=A0A010RIB3_9PEZI|nr:radical SAM superfamily protein [Colletotrichum fioriniae PJ7]
MSMLRRAITQRHDVFRRGMAGARRYLHLAPPFLLDDYTPRYMALTSIDESKKRSKAYAHLSKCNLCPRLCGVNRFETTGMCLIGNDTKVNVIAPHFGEEPCVQGHNGSGAVFFSGCNLRCVFCQNHDIAHQRNGQDLTPEELGECFDSLASLELLDGLVDIYLPDFKVWESATSKRLLKADDYAATARESIKAMHNQVGDLCFTGDGIAKSGLLVRHLVMPGKEKEGHRIMQFLAEEVSRDCFVNIMEQYHPDAHVGKTKRRNKKSTDTQDDELRYSEINRAVSGDEVSSVRKAAETAGLWRFCDPPRHDGFNI